MFKPIHKLVSWIPYDKIDWTTLSMNPNATSLLERNLDKVDWSGLCKNPNAIPIIEKNFDENLYVLSNPPFLGHISRSLEQTQELINVWGRKDIGRLDYVTAWYKKAMDTFGNIKNPHFAFVSTNSICQGEQTSLIWPYIFKKNQEIFF